MVLSDHEGDPTSQAAIPAGIPPTTTTSGSTTRGREG
jgi:hypothetical protein